MAVLKLENVSFSYDKRIDVLKNISLSVNEGEYISVVGKNGSGKSTLAKLFNALIIPDKGDVYAFGFNSKDSQNLFEIRKRVGVIFQNPDNQLVASIVEDDIAFGPENLGIDREEIGRRIDFALKAVGMEDFRKSSTERLSGGQKQRVAIAGVLALKPKVLILDESTSMLDPMGRKEILGIVKKLNKEQGVTVIAITHYMDEVIDSDRVIVVSDGRIALEGTPSEVFEERDMLVDWGLLLPPVTEISYNLKEKGIDVPNGILTEDALVEALCRLK